MRLMKGFEARGEQGKRSKLSRSLTGLYPQEHDQSETSSPDSGDLVAHARPEYRLAQSQIGHPHEIFSQLLSSASCRPSGLAILTYLDRIPFRLHKLACLPARPNRSGLSPDWTLSTIPWELVPSSEQLVQSWDKAFLFEAYSRSQECESLVVTRSHSVNKTSLEREFALTPTEGPPSYATKSPWLDVERPATDTGKERSLRKGLNKRLVASQESNREGRTGSQERRNETGGNALGGADNPLSLGRQDGWLLRLPHQAKKKEEEIQLTINNSFQSQNKASPKQSQAATYLLDAYLFQPVSLQPVGLSFLLLSCHSFPLAKKKCFPLPLVKPLLV
ncbi:hypothetical protein V6N11_014026 [Hibiscus sabdariffa]|uniref:Uncharacterized protein n=1 Tax=Hibiscus sabdariffa TaxID=183260 RepID=A0ABR2AFG3_9ROSI